MGVLKNKIYFLNLVCLLFLVAFYGCGDDNSLSAINASEKKIVKITNPFDETTVNYGDTVILAGQVERFPQDSTISDDLIIWNSDKDGILGYGDSILVSDLSINTHKITLKDFWSDHSDSTSIYVIEDCPEYEFYLLPPTSDFPMGMQDGTAAPVHSVALDLFYIGRYEVSFRLWRAVRVWAEANGYVFAYEGAGGYKSDEPQKHPAANISWRDAVAWCNAYSEKKGLTPIYYNADMEHTHDNVYRNSLVGGDIGNADFDADADGYRLPTEAEWEYAARYIDGDVFSPGSEYSGFGNLPFRKREEIIDSNIGSYCWFVDNSDYNTHWPGLRLCNYVNIYDMSGNVAEWCWDWFGEYSSEKQINPEGPESGQERVIRGGSWASYRDECDTSFRDSADPSLAYYFWGLRLCRSFNQ